MVDSTELFDEILDRALGRREPELGEWAVVDRVRLFAAPHVVEEVPRKIAANFARRGADPATGLRLWRHYESALRVVSTDGLPLQSPDVETLRAQDPSDVPTALLVLLLRPVIALSKDADLIRNGFAVRSHWVVALNVRMVAQGEVTVQAAAIVPRAVGLGVQELARKLNGWGLPGYLIIGALSLWGARYLKQKFQALPVERKDELLSLFGQLLEQTHAAFQRGEKARGVLGAHVVEPEGQGDELLRRMARELAFSEAPMTATELAAATAENEGPVSRSHFTAVKQRLEALSPFVRVGRYRWQLGIRASQLRPKEPI